MSLPNLIGKSFLTGEPTAVYQNHGAVSGPPVGKVQVALLPRFEHQAVEEIQRLLRKRLRFFAMVLSGGIAILLLVVFLRFGNDTAFWVFFAMMTVSAVSAWILWSPRPLSLPKLRMIEMIVFGAYLALAVWGHYHIFGQFWRLWKRTPEFADAHADLMAFAESLFWVFVIMAYGMLIPNTWRRCAAFVGITACIPLLLNAASGLTGATIEGQSLLNLLIVMGLNLAVAAALAVYGSHRIELLRRAKCHDILQFSARIIAT